MGSYFGVWVPHRYAKVLTYSFLNVCLYGLMISYVIQVDCNNLLFILMLKFSFLFFFFPLIIL